MTDDVEEKANTWPIMQSDIRGDGYGYFCWQPNPEYRFTGALNADNAWKRIIVRFLLLIMLLICWMMRKELRAIKMIY